MTYDLYIQGKQYREKPKKCNSPPKKLSQSPLLLQCTWEISNTMPCATESLKVIDLTLISSYPCCLFRRRGSHDRLELLKETFCWSSSSSLEINNCGDSHSHVFVSSRPLLGSKQHFIMFVQLQVLVFTANGFFLHPLLWIFDILHKF